MPSGGQLPPRSPPTRSDNPHAPEEVTQGKYWPPALHWAPSMIRPGYPLLSGGGGGGVVVSGGVVVGGGVVGAGVVPVGVGVGVTVLFGAAV